MSTFDEYLARVPEPERTGPSAGFELLTSERPHSTAHEDVFGAGAIREEVKDWPS